MFSVKRNDIDAPDRVSPPAQTPLIGQPVQHVTVRVDDQSYKIPQWIILNESFMLWHVHAQRALIHSNSYPSNHRCWWGNMSGNLLVRRAGFMGSTWTHGCVDKLFRSEGRTPRPDIYAQKTWLIFFRILTSEPSSIHPESDHTRGPHWQLSPTVKLGLCFRHQDLNINLISLPMSLLLSSLGT